MSLAIAAQLLQPGSALDRRLAIGEAPAFDVDAKRGEFIAVAVEQRLIDVMVTVRDPSGQQIGTFDSPTGNLGSEKVRFIAQADGRYRLEIRAVPTEGEPGRYRIGLAARRLATTGDERVVAAIAAQAEATRLRGAPETRAASIARYEQAMALWREAADPSGETDALRAMGFAQVRLRDDEAAYRTFARTRAMWHSLGETRSEAFALLVLGTIHTRRGEHAETRARALEALPLWQRAGDREEEAFTLGEIGSTFARTGVPADAERWFARAMEVASRSGRPSLQAAILNNLGRAREALRDTAGAARAYDRAALLWDRARMPKQGADSRRQAERVRSAASR